MAKYINVTLAKAEFTGNFQDSYPPEQIKAMLDEVPAADVVEVKHGKWERRPDPYGFFDDIPVCSECGCTTKYREETLYCPHCGADMKERR